MGSKKSSKVTQLFYCEECDYSTCRQVDYNKHLLTDKHKKKENGSKMIVNDSDLSQKVTQNQYQHECICGKVYKYDSGYYRHKKKCTHELSAMAHGNLVFDKEFVMMILQQNKEVIHQNQEVMKQNMELQTNVLEIMKNGTHNTNSHNNNKTFNLQFFLNETCKGAMNIMDFIDSIKPTLEDLETTGKVGYIEGISKIIVDNLKGLETCERPIHCSNIKKEVLYIKDQDKWSQEKPILTKAIHTLAHKNINNINEWKAENPGCKDADSTKNDTYLNIIMNSMSGSSQEESINNMNKIITKVAKEVVIDK